MLSAIPQFMYDEPPAVRALADQLYATYEPKFFAAIIDETMRADATPFHTGFGVIDQYKRIGAAFESADLQAIRAFGIEPGAAAGSELPALWNQVRDGLQARLDVVLNDLEAGRVREADLLSRGSALRAVCAEALPTAETLKHIRGATDAAMNTAQTIGEAASDAVRHASSCATIIPARIKPRTPEPSVTSTGGALEALEHNKLAFGAVSAVALCAAAYYLLGSKSPETGTHSRS